MPAGIGEDFAVAKRVRRRRVASTGPDFADESLVAALVAEATVFANVLAPRFASVGIPLGDQDAKTMFNNAGIMREPVDVSRMRLLFSIDHLSEVMQPVAVWQYARVRRVDPDVQNFADPWGMNTATRTAQFLRAPVHAALTPWRMGAYVEAKDHLEAARNLTDCKLSVFDPEDFRNRLDKVRRVKLSDHVRNFRTFMALTSSYRINSPDEIVDVPGNEEILGTYLVGAMVNIDGAGEVRMDGYFRHPNGELLNAYLSPGLSELMVTYLACCSPSDKPFAKIGTPRPMRRGEELVLDERDGLVRWRRTNAAHPLRQRRESFSTGRVVDPYDRDPIAYDRKLTPGQKRALGIQDDTPNRVYYRRWGRTGSRIHGDSEPTPPDPPAWRMLKSIDAWVSDNSDNKPNSKIYQPGDVFFYDFDDLEADSPKVLRSQYVGRFTVDGRFQRLDEMMPFTVYVDGRPERNEPILDRELAFAPMEP